MKIALKISCTAILFSFIILFMASSGVVSSKTNYGSAAAGKKTVKIIFLHHSTGECIWKGGVSEWFRKYNSAHGTNYQITEQIFPKDSPYGWKNYPYDYWNIWVKHAGNKQFMNEPTLEILAKKYDVIIWKHCFPVGDLEEDTGSSDVTSEDKRVENYKLQYEALKNKMREFPNKKFIVWTGAAKVSGDTNMDSAKRTRTFFEWVKTEWDEKGDNVYIWDFYGLETNGGIYLKNEYAAGKDDSHPNSSFSRKAASLFCQRIVDVIEGRGDGKSLTGDKNF